MKRSIVMGPHFILPVGTQVVTLVEVECPGELRSFPVGAVGEVVQAPRDVTGVYRVRMPNGFVARLRRGEVEVRKVVQAGEIGAWAGAARVPNTLPGPPLAAGVKNGGSPPVPVGVPRGTGFQPGSPGRDHGQDARATSPPQSVPTGDPGTAPDAPIGIEPEPDWTQYIIYRCTIGSRAYGLHGDDSDTDTRGIFLPPAERHWSLYGVPEQVEDHAAQSCYWELQKFLTLALKANPNILECLYTSLVEFVAPPADALLAMRASFLSQRIYQTYNGYVLSQFKKLQRHQRNQGGIKWKHAMHLIRLLLAGVTAIREGYILVDVGEHRERLLAIRRGEMHWKEVNAWRLSLHREFDAAFSKTRLPPQPDYAAADRLLVKARRMMVGCDQGPP